MARSLRLLALVPFAALALACSAPGGGGIDAGPAPDTGPPDRPDTGPEAECLSNDECESGFLCAAVGGVPMCVPDPDPPPPGDGTDCSPCDAPGECRDGVCVQPSSSGAFCEFDPECGDDLLCIAGRCTPDPRVPTPCETDGDCYAGLTCSATMVCECAFTTDCPIGTVCRAGSCTPEGGETPCVSDMECAEAEVCDGARCRPDAVCEIAHPDLAGDWAMTSILNVREALPDWLDDFLVTMEEPLRFLAGDASCFDFGLPDWVENEICELARPLIEDHVPSWVRALARAIADINDVLNTWEIEETMTLTAGTATDSYRGTHTWNRIRMFYRGMPLMGTPETISGWRFSPSPFNASAVCGTFHIERHDVNVSVAAIIAWAVDVLVYAVSEGEYDSLRAALTAVSAGFCEALAGYAESVTDYDVADTVTEVCTTAVAGQIERAIDRLIEARIGADAITLRGSGSVAGPNSIRPGVWDGTLLGSEFSGSFSASR